MNTDSSLWSVGMYPAFCPEQVLRAGSAQEVVGTAWHTLRALSGEVLSSRAGLTQGSWHPFSALPFKRY